MTNGLDMEALAVKEEDLDVDIDALDDSQLYEMLKENNIVAGPIVDSTRNVYKKRLRTVLYGDDREEDEVASASNGESEDDGESEEEVVAEEETNGKDLNHKLEEPPMEIKDKDRQEVLDFDDEGPYETKSDTEVLDFDEGPYESKSDTEDDQPSGISRPVDLDTPTGLRKRFQEDVTDATKSDNERAIGKGSGSVETSSGWVTKAMLAVMVVLIIVAVILFFISSMDLEVPETLDAMQEAIQEAANKAAEEMEDDIAV